VQNASLLDRHSPKIDVWNSLSHRLTEEKTDARLHANVARVLNPFKRQLVFTSQAGKTRVAFSRAIIALISTPFGQICTHMRPGAEARALHTPTPIY